jgi:chlorinating enzyme
MANLESVSIRGSGAMSERPSAGQLLTSLELENYRRDGFVVPRFRLSQEETGRLHSLILRLVETNPRFADFLMQSPHIPGHAMQDLKSFPGWMEFAAHPMILDMVEQIMGPDIILRGSAAFYKRPGKGPPTAWHRDATGARGIKPITTTSVWIAASDSFIENACLRFIPGSHAAKRVGEHIFGQFEDFQSDGAVGPALIDGEVDVTKAADVELEAGQMVIFDIFTAHASRPNLGTRERASYALRYIPGTSYYDHDATPEELSSNGYGHHARPLILLRGEDRAGNDFRRGHPASPRA